MTAPFDTIEITPTAKHQYSVIWLHGLGADGHDFEGIVPQLDSTTAKHIHFVFPNAPIQAVTINGGMAMRAWFDILELSMQRTVDIDGIYRSAAHLEQLIDRELDSGIGAENILLAGFSQGSVIALHTGLRYRHRLAGIIALSGYLPTSEQLASEREPSNNSTPVFMAHGSHDPVVDISAGKAAYMALKDLNYAVEWREYPMQHAVCQEEIKHISEFINRVFCK